MLDARLLMWSITQCAALSNMKGLAVFRLLDKMGFVEYGCFADQRYCCSRVLPQSSPYGDSSSSRREPLGRIPCYCMKQAAAQTEVAIQRKNAGAAAAQAAKEPVRRFCRGFLYSASAETSPALATLAHCKQ